MEKLIKHYPDQPPIVTTNVVVSTATPLSALEKASIPTIFGQKGLSKTIKIQELPPQKPEVLEQYTSLPKSKQIPIFQLSRPFRMFSNIENNDLTYCNGPTGNHFFDAFYIAWATHGGIVLSPDDVWLAIMSSFTKYVNDNAEELREKIVSHKEKKQLVVTYLDPDLPSNPDIKAKCFKWDLFTEGYAKLIEKETKGDIANLVLNNFSTTGLIEKSASQTALMYCCEKYFIQRGLCGGCGIANAHMLGELQDWQNLREKLKGLKYYSVPKVEQDQLAWIDKLDEILIEFINTFEGKPNIVFWNSVIDEKKSGQIKFGSGSINGYLTSQVITGWIKHFFFFDRKGQMISNENSNLTHHLYNEEFEKFALKNTGNGVKEMIKEIMINMPKEICKGIRINTIPAFEWRAPVIIEWVSNPKKCPIYLIGGFTGVLMEKNAFRPQISLGIQERVLTPEESKLKPLT